MNIRQLLVLDNLNSDKYTLDIALPEFLNKYVHSDVHMYLKTKMNTYSLYVYMFMCTFHLAYALLWIMYLTQHATILDPLKVHILQLNLSICI